MAIQISLKDVWNKPIETLSKGFKRRVGIAQALIHDPDILILDEPTDGLDPNQKHEMRNLIKNISRNKAIVISTHILEEVEAVCSRAMIIADGKLLANETPSNIEKQFANKDVITIKVFNKINAVLAKNLKSSLNYSDVKIEKLDKDTNRIFVSDPQKTPDLNAVLKQVNKFKLNIIEASFVKSSLEEIFRKITTTNASK
jgi:ABC-2 type transport system ATP-binding protein